MFDQFNNKNYKDLQNLLANKMNLSETQKIRLISNRTGNRVAPTFQRSGGTELTPEQQRNFAASNQQGIEQAEEIDRQQQAASLERLKAAYKQMGLDYDEVQRRRAAEREESAQEQQTEQPTEQIPATNPNHGTSSSY